MSQLIDESPTASYDSLDPAVGFFVTDGYFPNVFQGLVQYSNANGTQVVPSLASNWTISPNLENYTFSMRPNTWFSNTDPITAYSAWFSFVRGNYINAPSTAYYSNYVDLFYAGSTPPADCPTNSTASRCEPMPDSHGNVWPWGLKAALSATLNIPITNENELVDALNWMLSHFNPVNATQREIMAYAGQAFVAPSASTFQMNLIQPYRLLLLALPPQWGAIVDPAYIDANGGVTNNTVVARLSNGGMVGSGPYVYGTIGRDESSLVLNSNPSYWARSTPNLPSVLQPAKIPTVIMVFGDEPGTETKDFDSGNAQIVSPGIGSENSLNQTEALGDFYSNYTYAKYFAFSRLLVNGGYPLCDLGYGLNTQVFPTNSTLLREGMVHAINYSQFLSEFYTFDGQALAENFLPPVPPGWGPLDNPQNLPLYTYNITLATEYVNEAGIQGGWYTVTPSGKVLGDSSGSLLPLVNYSAPFPTPLEEAMVGILASGLAQIGIRIAPQPYPSQYEAVSPPTPPPPITGVGWCADWSDPILQQFDELATEAGHEANMVNNATLNALAAKIPFETNSTQQLEDTIKAYAIFTQLSTIIQMPNQAIIYAVQPYLKGLVYSQFQFGFYYNLMYYSPAVGT